MSFSNAVLTEQVSVQPHNKGAFKCIVMQCRVGGIQISQISATNVNGPPLLVL